MIRVLWILLLVASSVLWARVFKGKTRGLKTCIKSVISIFGMFNLMAVQINPCFTFLNTNFV